MSEQKITLKSALELAKQIPDHFSISSLQRKFRVGYTVAAKIIEEMRALNLVGQYDINAQKCQVYLNNIAKYEACAQKEATRDG